jgi:hypothetical protein
MRIKTKVTKKRADGMEILTRGKIAVMGGKNGC